MKAQLAAYRRTLEATFGQRDDPRRRRRCHRLPWLETPDQALVWGMALGLRKDIEAVMARTAKAAPAQARPPTAYSPAVVLAPAPETRPGRGPDGLRRAPRCVEPGGDVRGDRGHRQRGRPGSPPLTSARARCLPGGALRDAARGGPARSNVTPRSRSETHASWPITTWSRTSTSSSRPAAIASAVRCRSSGLGVGSPEGWLWTSIDAARVEPDGVAEQLADPDQRRRHVADVDRRHPLDDVLRVEAEHPELLALETTHLDEQPVGDVARRADRPLSGRPVRDRPAPELERRPRASPPWPLRARDGGQLGVRRAGQRARRSRGARAPPPRARSRSARRRPCPA